MAIFNTWRKVTALVFAVSLLLGLVATGCSNGNSGSSGDNYNTELTVVLNKGTGEKGTLPSDTADLTLVLYSSDGVPLDGFASDGLPEGVNCVWEEQDDELYTTLHVKDSSADNIAQLMVFAFDEDDNVLGTYSDTVNLLVGESNTVNFGTNSAPFVSAEDMQDSIEHFSVVTTGVVDSKGVVTVAAEVENSVYLIDKYSNQDDVVFNAYRWTDDEYTLSDPIPASAPVTVNNDKKTFVGDDVVSGVKIELYEKDTENLLDTINFNVVVAE